MMVMPLALPTALAAPLGLTVPLTPWPIILPLLTTTAEVLPPEQVVATATTIHAPSKLPPPPPPLRFDEDLRGTSSDPLRRDEGSGAADRGSDREPESDFSSLPMLPPVLPDCARATLEPLARTNNAHSKPALGRTRKSAQGRWRIIFCIAMNFRINEDYAFSVRTRPHTPRR
jgi:hypothetical protein